MPCGTVVLATPVGGVPDLIKDGETGFILENNTPECIASNVIRALSHPNLGGIAGNARRLIEQEYGRDAMVEKRRIALDKLMNHERGDSTGDCDKHEG
jgi:glycosyltransferase involved in cell wall biosynthesis